MPVFRSSTCILDHCHRRAQLALLHRLHRLRVLRVLRVGVVVVLDRVLLLLVLDRVVLLQLALLGAELVLVHEVRRVAMGGHEVRICAVFADLALGHRVDVVELRQEDQRLRDKDASARPQGRRWTETSVVGQSRGKVKVG